MNPIIAVEFSARSSDDELIQEESVTLHSVEEFLAFIAPGGGCEAIPDEVAEIKIVFLPTAHHKKLNSIAQLNGSLQIGMVFINGPLTDIVHATQLILEKAVSDELSDSFCKVIGR